MVVAVSGQLQLTPIPIVIQTLFETQISHRLAAPLQPFARTLTCHGIVSRKHQARLQRAIKVTERDLTDELNLFFFRYDFCLCADVNRATMQAASYALSSVPVTLQCLMNLHAQHLHTAFLPCALGVNMDSMNVGGMLASVEKVGSFAKFFKRFCQRFRCQQVI